MLIKALCDYYDCRNEKDLSEIPEGYGMQAVSWQVHLTEKGGDFLQLMIVAMKWKYHKKRKIRMERSRRNHQK